MSTGYESDSTDDTIIDDPGTGIRDLNQEIEQLIRRRDAFMQSYNNMYYEWFYREPTSGYTTPPRRKIDMDEFRANKADIERNYETIQNIVKNLTDQISEKQRERDRIIQSNPPSFMEPPPAGGARRSQVVPPTRRSQVVPPTRRSQVVPPTRGKPRRRKTPKTRRRRKTPKTRRRKNTRRRARR